jgi:outer membrane lipoprotein-sorting protein
MPHFMNKISRERSICIGLASFCWMLTAPTSSTQVQAADLATVAYGSANEALVRPKIDPAARAILDTMAATYKSATSYSGKFDIQRTGLPDSPSSTGEVAWQRPDKFKIVGKVKAVTNTYVYDGTRFSYSSSRFPGEYVQVTPDPERDVLTEAVTETATDGSAIIMLMSGQDPTKGLTNILQTLSVVTPGTVAGAGKDTDVVVATFERTWSTGTVTYVIGKNDHLLRQVSMSQTTRGKTVTIVETHSDVQLNAASPSTFRFVPAPAAVRVDEPEPVQVPGEGNMGRPPPQ